MSGWLAVLGLGPGAASLLTPEAAAALDGATDLVGYGPYVDRVPDRPGLRRHATENRAELNRARHALEMAAAGRRVALVSAGDAGVFGMASAVFETLEAGPPDWHMLDVRVVPGVSAVLAVAARLGAPLGADFCVLSLSDNLKPWPLIERRLRAASSAGFALALYNPASRARTDQLGRAFAVLRDVLPGTVPVVFATAVTRPDERIGLATLGTADPARADMRSLVLVGTEATRLIERPGGRPWLYAPRRAT